jgi:hypothetical protein
MSDQTPARGGRWLAPAAIVAREVLRPGLPAARGSMP